MKLLPTSSKHERNNIVETKDNVMVSNINMLTAYKEITREINTNVQNILEKVQNLLDSFGDICSIELPPSFAPAVRYTPSH